MSEKLSECRMTHAVLDPRSEMQTLLHKVAGVGGSVKERINRASRKIGLSYSRAKDLWYGDQRAAIKAEELEKARIVARETLGASLEVIDDLKARIAALEQQIALLGRQAEAPSRVAAD